MGLFRPQDERGIEPADGRGPGPAVSSATRRLSVRPDHATFLHVGLEELLRGLVRRFDRVEMEDGPAHSLAIRVMNLADLQRRVGRARRYFNVRVRRPSARWRAWEPWPHPGSGGSLRTSRQPPRARRCRAPRGYCTGPRSRRWR